MLADRIPYAFPERYDAAYRAELNHFADVIDDIAAPLTGFAESRAALALAEAAARSVREGRSEEHTSELQSLMRISYAVFCLKKKKKQTTSQQTKRCQRHQTANNSKQSCTHTI